MYVSLMEKKGMEKERMAIAREMLNAGEPEERILRYARITPEQLENTSKRVPLCTLITLLKIRGETRSTFYHLQKQEETKR